MHVLGIRSKTQVTTRVLGDARRLLTLGCFCIGTNQVDLGEANKQRRARLQRAVLEHARVAEMILAEIVMLSRQLGDRSREVHAGKWRKVATGCFEVRGKTLGIVGYGHIGRQLGVLAEAMGMRVVFFDIAAQAADGQQRAGHDARGPAGPGRLRDAARARDAADART